MIKINFFAVRDQAAPQLELKKKIIPSAEFLKRSQKLILSAQTISFTVDLFYDEPLVIGDYQVQADLVVPSSRSLEPVPLKQNFHFQESYALTDNLPNDLAQDDSIIKIEDQEIDLQKAVEDNLLLSIPTTVLTPQEKAGLYPAGQDWQVISEKKFSQEDQGHVNPAFAKLKILLDQKEKQAAKKKNDQGKS